jgi:hypothetical protein
METDVSEQKNLYNKHPEVVEELANMLIKIVDDGRSTPGEKLKNDIDDIDIWKGITPIEFKN